MVPGGLAGIVKHPVYDEPMQTVTGPRIFTTQSLQDHQGLAEVFGPIHGPL